MHQNFPRSEARLTAPGIVNVMPRRPETDQARVTVAGRLHPEWVDKLDQRCAHAGLTRTQYLRKAIRFAIRYMPNNWNGEPMWWETEHHGQSDFSSVPFEPAP